MVSVIKPNWPAPDNVHAYTTTRIGGYSKKNYAGLNLATSVNDNLNVVRKNRTLLQKKLALPSAPVWLDQVHGIAVTDAATSKKNPKADAAFTNKANIVCATLTADCLPILICNTQGNCVAAIHAGWRGLAHGIIETTLKALPMKPNDTLVWLGPAIGPTAFEIGKDVYTAFTETDHKTKKYFHATNKDHWLADIYSLATQHLIKCKVKQIYGDNYCTFTEEKLFFSYRRDKNCGRMATLIWFTAPD